MSSTQKVVLVIGAAGFLGFSISRAFSLKGYRVYGLIRSANSADKLRTEEIIPVFGSVESDAWLKDIANEQFDVVVTATEDLIDPGTHTRHLLDRVFSIAKQNKGKKLHAIYTSGIKDYGPSGLAGEAGFHIITEETPKDDSTFRNILGHRATAAGEFFTSEQIYGTVITPSMIYGKYHSWYAWWFQQALNGDVIKVIGYPNTVWHGVHVDDVARAYVVVAEQGGATTHKQIYLVANDNYEKVGDIVSAISKETGGHHKIEFVAPTQTFGDALASYSQWIDNKKIRSLGWSPEKPTIIAGIKQYVESYRGAMKDPLTKPMPTPDQINVMAAQLGKKL